jgi:hypothetical protein
MNSEDPAIEDTPFDGKADVMTVQNRNVPDFPPFASRGGVEAQGSKRRFHSKSSLVQTQKPRFQI